MTEYAYIIEATGTVPMDQQVEWDAYQQVNDVYVAALAAGQVPMGVDRIVRVGPVAVIPHSQGRYKHRIGWYVRDLTGLPIRNSPYLISKELGPDDFFV